MLVTHHGCRGSVPLSRHRWFLYLSLLPLMVSFSEAAEAKARGHGGGHGGHRLAGRAGWELGGRSSSSAAPWWETEAMVARVRGRRRGAWGGGGGRGPASLCTAPLPPARAAAMVPAAPLVSGGT